MAVEASAKKPGSLRKIFGRVAAVTSLAATIAFYALGFQISAAYYEQWQDNKAHVTQSWDGDKTNNLPWAPAGGALALSLGAGFAGIAAAKSRRRDCANYYASSSGYNNGYYGGNDNFWWGYWLGSSNSGGGSSSSSSSNDNGGAAAAVVIVAGVALAAGASIVSYKALKENFQSDPDEWKQNKIDTTAFDTKFKENLTPANTSEPSEIPAPVKKNKGFEL